ncbi:MAG TPA: glycosyltransferase [Acidisarcina sp.]
MTQSCRSVPGGIEESALGYRAPEDADGSAQEPATAGPEAARVRRRILLVQTLLKPHGGSFAVTAWVMQALAKDYDVTLLTLRPVDLSALDVHFGTSLCELRIKIKTVSPFLRSVLGLDPDDESIQPSLWVQRIAKRIRHRYDLVFSTEMESDLGGGGMQYLHAPWLEHVYPHVRRSCDLPWMSKVAAVLKGEIQPWMLVGDYSFDRMVKNLTLCNSDWTAGRLRALYGIEATTVYPPAPGVYPRVPWQERSNGVISIGRLTVDKRFEFMIEQLAALRVDVPDLTYHIVGSTNPKTHKTEFYRRLLRAVQANSHWITLHEDASRQELAEVASSQRYGLHAMVDEHFGIAAAEMVRAGCIPFVHNSGGQVEIVDGDEQLIFNDDELAGKMKRVVRDASKQETIRAALGVRAALFTPEHFMSETCRLVRSALSENRMGAS